MNTNEYNHWTINAWYVEHVGRLGAFMSYVKANGLDQRPKFWEEWEDVFTAWKKAGRP